MTRAFWHPTPGMKVAAWWARCDNCHWSGPTERFDVYQRGDDLVWLCHHWWCRANHDVLDHLVGAGWEKIS